MHAKHLGHKAIWATLGGWAEVCLGLEAWWSVVWVHCEHGPSPGMPRGQVAAPGLCHQLTIQEPEPPSLQACAAGSGICERLCALALCNGLTLSPRAHRRLGEGSIALRWFDPRARELVKGWGESWLRTWGLTPEPAKGWGGGVSALRLGFDPRACERMGGGFGFPLGV